MYDRCTIDASMLTLYRRHRRACSKSSDRFYKRCTCPMWIEGTTNGTYIRRSLKTGSRGCATDLGRVIEDAEDPAATPERKDEPVTVIQAVTEYLADAKARELSVATIYKLDIFFRKQFLAWCKAEGYRLLRETDLRAVQAFRASWKDRAMAKKKKQERLTGFFWFCIPADWISTNPTNKLGRISVTQAPTDYFPREEYEKLLDATYLYRENRGEIGTANATRLRTLIMLMRWSGLRIRDALTLERTRLIKRQPAALPSENRNAGLRAPSASSGGRTTNDSGRSQAQSALFLLERKRFAEDRGGRLAAEFSPALQTGQTGEGRRIGEALLSPHDAGHLCASRCCWPEFPSIRYRCCSAIPA